MTYGTFGLCLWLFMMSSLGIIALAHSRKINQRKIMEEQVRLLESAMRKATKEKLADAKETLLIVSFNFSYGYVELPKFFWEINDLTLVARTLRTCIKIFLNNNNAADPLSAKKAVYGRLNQELVKLASAHLGRAMSILAILCVIDKDAASMMANHLAQIGERGVHGYVMPFEI